MAYIASVRTSLADETLRILARPCGLVKTVLFMPKSLAFLFISFKNLLIKVFVES